MQLAYKQLGNGKPLVIIHGLYGSSDNWYSIGKSLSPYYQVFIIDLRNHGKSPHSKVHTYDAMQADLFDFFIEHNLQKAVIIGHSMGGKTAMLFSLLHPEMVESLIVVDISPKEYKSLTSYHTYAIEHLNIMQAFLSVDVSQYKTRAEIDNDFSKYVKDLNIRHFLLKNVGRKENGQYYWILNIDALNNALPEILDGIDLTKINYKKEDIIFPTLFIKGEKSKYIDEEDLTLIKQFFPKADLVTIFDAGHWVHAEQPEAFLKTIKYFLSIS